MAAASTSIVPAPLGSCSAAAIDFAIDDVGHARREHALASRIAVAAAAGDEVACRVTVGLVVVVMSTGALWLDRDDDHRLLDEARTILNDLWNRTRIPGVA